MEIGIHNLEQLDEILQSLSAITTLLGDSLDENTQIKSRLYKALSSKNVSTKLSEHNQLIELMKNGEEELVKEYMESEKEVQKLKYSQRYAVEALNTKKHQNNVIKTNA